MLAAQAVVSESAGVRKHTCIWPSDGVIMQVDVKSNQSIDKSITLHVRKQTHGAYFSIDRCRWSRISTMIAATTDCEVRQHVSHSL